MPRGVKVGGLRSAASRDEVQEEKTALPERKTGKFQYRSRYAGHLVSLRRRRIERGPDGERIEVAPRSKLDTALDWVRFENNYFETADPELAALIEKHPSYGMSDQGGEFWSLETERQAHETARASELRRQLAELPPEVRERVLRPVEAEDLSVPQT